jgi:hypothetical protein
MPERKSRTAEEELVFEEAKRRRKADAIALKESVRNSLTSRY